MKSLVTGMAIGILGVLATSNPLSAQWRVRVGGGASFPVSNFGDYVDTGVLVVAGISLSSRNSGLNISAETFESRHSNSDNAFDETSPFGLMVGLGYDFAGPEADSSPYVFGQLGVLVEDEIPSGFFARGPDSALALGAGAGYYFPLARLRGRVEGRFMRASSNRVNTSFFGIVAYIGIPLGD